LQLYELTAQEAHEKLIKREVSSRELTQSVLDRIDSVEDRVKAFVTVTKEQALKKADEIDAKIAAGESIPVGAGVPLALKDNLCTKGVETTCSSKILRGFLPPYNATVVDKLSRVGTPFVGKANLDEFAMGSSTENSAFFPTHNPWDLSRAPGGSSGGSAASVAAGEGFWALGSDTGGSIRQPASFCGVVGLKPTYGRVSRFGLVAFASSLDQIGPLTKSVYDSALLLNLISGHDPNDSTSIEREVPDYTKSCVCGVKGLKIGAPKEYFAEGVSEEVKTTIRAAIKVLEEQGAIVEETSLPITEYALATYYIIAPAEASSNLARYDGVRFGHRSSQASNPLDMFNKTRKEGFGAEVKQRIMIGTYALSAGYYDAFYLKAQKVRTLIKQDFERAFEKYDALITPTAPTPAFKLGEKTTDPLEMKLSDILTIPINMAGLPAISIPAGFSSEGLPIGLQLIGAAFSEETLFRMAYTYEQATAWHAKRATL
jgi:aspartyl-tRNA(Asn)/glutamyl-tRNA(Gln) amidotransferase subunit A